MLPPLFTDSSHRLPHGARAHTPGTITGAIPPQPTEESLQILFGAKLKEVFPYGLPRASHQPAAFCAEFPNATYSYHRLSSFIFNGHWSLKAIIYERQKDVKLKTTTHPFAQFHASL